MLTIISVEGQIGVGKTFLLHNIRKELNKLGINNLILTEPTESWERLKVVDEIEKNSTNKAAAQVYIFSTLRSRLENNLNFNGVIIIERSIRASIAQFCSNLDEFSLSLMYELGKIDNHINAYVNIEISDFNNLQNLLKRIKENSNLGLLAANEIILYNKVLSSNLDKFFLTINKPKIDFKFDNYNNSLKEIIDFIIKTHNRL